jgi:hypothetical protein
VRTKCAEKTSVGLWGQSRDPRELPGVTGPSHGVVGVLQIASYRYSRPLCHDIEQVEKYIAYIGAHELDSLINEKFETSHEARVMKEHLDAILQICINEFSDNVYVIKYKERIIAAMESTNILHEEYDQSISIEE